MPQEDALDRIGAACAETVTVRASIAMRGRILFRSMFVVSAKAGAGHSQKNPDPRSMLPNGRQHKGIREYTSGVTRIRVDGPGERFHRAPDRLRLSIR